jgi:hypothetical protein
LQKREYAEYASKQGSYWNGVAAMFPMLMSIAGMKSMKSECRLQGFQKKHVEGWTQKFC